ncbi:MAG TPA: DNA cytosine methyltransferase [Rhizomicrobium sp.]|jgi:DNA (cytosine-5)-methyltransferase 1
MTTFGSFCSGIEAASIAFMPLGWEPAFYSEIEDFPIAVLKYRHAARDLRIGRAAGTVPLWGDMAAMRVRHLKRFGIEMPDVLIAGTPCQGFSLAGLRGSLSDARSNLALTFVRIAHAIDHVREREGKSGLIVVWENVPGVLTTGDNAFGCFLGGFVGADDPLVPPDAIWGPLPHFDDRSYNVHRTYGWQSCRWPSEGLAEGPRARAAWRVLDAQYFGLAQRRERVFAVICFRDAADPAAILFERLGLRGNSPPRREARKDIAPTIAARASGGGGLGTDSDCDGGLVTREASHCLNGGGHG